MENGELETWLIFLTLQFRQSPGVLPLYFTYCVNYAEYVSVACRYSKFHQDRGKS